ncbi:Transposase and inactivated derivatives, partial [Nitrosomonas eutropha]|uniref:transposase n=1 Tax=Nitrosomonas eutropha TaxID=916 RepID=UPI000894A84C
MEPRKHYTKEFKLDAISLVLDQGLTIAEAARSLEIRANMLGRWIRESQADTNGQAFRGNGKLTPEQKYKVTTDSNHPLPVFENQLNRQFTVARPDQV